MEAIHPIASTSSGPGSNISPSIWVAKNIFWSPSMATSTAFNDLSLLISKSFTISGKIVKSRRATIGRLLLSSYINSFSPEKFSSFKKWMP